MLVDRFDFDLPPDRIAQEPRPRGESRLLHLSRNTGSVAHRSFRDLSSILRSGDLLVRNDARVVPARLLGQTEDGRPMELLLVAVASEDATICMARPARRARVGARIALPEGVEARVEEVLHGGRRRVFFSPALTPEWIERAGHVPLPPYIKRADVPADRVAYQTIFARANGAVAAPTAGLHFTAGIFQSLQEKGVTVADLTLLVGPGTFQRVNVSDTDFHEMEPEKVSIPAETAQRIEETRRNRGRIVAVGTTVTRALEAWVRLGRPEFATNLFITPGFDFKIVDALITNFHLPRSTLLMLICAFAGQERALAAYAAAVREGYLFYSYGDAMFVD